MGKMRTIDGHTFDEALLTDNAWVIDAGCRGFRFSEYFHRRRGYNNERSHVYAIDIDDLRPPHGIGFTRAALYKHPGVQLAHFFGNGTGNFLKGLNDEPYHGEDRPCQTKVVQCITLNEIYDEIGTNIDLLKLDIEASEYEVMIDMEPIPKQITVEFHEHCHKKIHDQYIDAILERLHKWYHINLYIREWPQYKFMDCLFIRKDIL